MRVTTHKPGKVLVKVPLGAGSLEDFIRADAEPGKDHRELVYQRNVEVTPDADRTIALPFHNNLPEEHVERVVGALEQAVAEVRRRR